VQEVSDTNPGLRNSILRNSIYNNAELGIQLGADGVTLNDLGDGDTGPNALQNFPVITSAAISNGSTPIFGSPAPDPSGNGEGKTFVGEKDVDTNTNGNASFSFVPNRVVPLSSRVTATTGSGNTSEFSNARIVVRPL